MYHTSTIITIRNRIGQSSVNQNTFLNIIITITKQTITAQITVINYTNALQYYSYAPFVTSESKTCGNVYDNVYKISHKPFCFCSKCSKIAITQVVWRVTDVNLEDFSACIFFWQRDVDALFKSDSQKNNI